jgi:quercetin dioxygenase-like cupin family protein
MSKNFLQTVRVLASAVVLATNLVTLPAAAAQPTGVTRTDLQRHDLSVPGREAVQVRVDLAPGVAFGRHTHPGEEIIYVLAGTMEYDVDGKPPATLKAGDVLFIPAGTVHTAKNVGKETASELATYVVEKEKPLLTLVK